MTDPTEQASLPPITAVEITPAPPGHGKVRAYCTLVVSDSLAIHGVRVIERSDRSLFVAMPSRKLASACVRCGEMNPLRANYCGRCGMELPAPAAIPTHGESGRPKYHSDVAHPITEAFRVSVESSVLASYMAATADEAVAS